MITEIAGCSGNAIMRRCEHSPDFHVRAGEAAVWAGLACGMAEEARPSGDLPGFVAADAWGASRAGSAADCVLCPDAHGDAPHAGASGTDSSCEPRSPFMRLRFVCSACGGKPARAWDRKLVWRRI